MENNSQTSVLNKIWALGINAWLPVFAFAIPFLISGPQLLTGSIVNTLLFITSAKQLNRKSLYFIALFPSLGAISNGIVFGKFTPFLLFFIPSIWLGNILLILSFAKLKNVISFPFNIIIASFIKTTVLYFSAIFFISIHFVPKIFETSMGFVQLATALIGGLLTIVLFKFAKRKL